MHRDRRRRLLPPLLVALPVTLALCAAGACIPDVVPSPSTLPRCAALDAGCGVDGKDDCCASDKVAGGQFNRLNNNGDPAQVDTFKLDRYETTVGRFRAFVAGYPLNKPQPGDGVNPTLGPESGWNASWDKNLPADQSELLEKIQCDQFFETWTPTAGKQDGEPMNCMTWYLAFAFCAWDGGWLPTQAEWSYAATGGDLQRIYPWGSAAPDAQHAIFGCQTDMTVCPLPRVGSAPAGAGNWGQMDLAGSLSEWTFDYFGTLPTGCDDACVQLEDGGFGRDLQGGDFAHENDELLNSFVVGVSPDDRESYIGFRCARGQ
jgi:sulfatase modifying factor 1